MFSLKLRPETRARLDEENKEVLRLFSLTDAWLATALLGMSRQARKVAGLAQPDVPTYDSRLVWGILPELARRLGTPRRLVLEEIDWEIRNLSNYELRVRLGHTLYNVRERSLAPWNLLTRIPSNGNPVAIAMDRLHPGTLGDKGDPITKSLEEVCQHRKTAYSGVWTPASIAQS
jgi:hypothetical protein